MKSCSDSTANFFNRSRSNHSNSVFVEENTKKVKSYEIEKLINKRQTKRRESKYLIRWRDYELENDDWKNIFEFDDVMNLIRKYEKVIRNITFLFERLKFVDTFLIFSTTKSKKSFVVVVIRKFISITINKSAFDKFFFVVVVRKFFSKSITSFFFVVTIRKFFSIAVTQSTTKKSFFVNVVSIFKQKFVVVIFQ